MHFQDDFTTKLTLRWGHFILLLLYKGNTFCYSLAIAGLWLCHEKLISKFSLFYKKECKANHLFKTM